MNDDYLLNYVLRIVGALAGVLSSLIMVAPEGTKNSLYRVLVGVTMGVIFSPVLDSIPFLQFLSGDDAEHVIARAAACGFSIWFILEATARFLSSTDWIVGTAREIIRLRNNSGGNDK